MISIALSLLIFPIFLYAFRAWHVSRLVSMSLVGVACVAIVFVWFPWVTNWIASVMGVGRGADLVIYVYCLTSFILILDQALKIKTQHQIITRLAREMAISGAVSARDGMDKER